MNTQMTEEAKRIREQYLPKEDGKLQQLKQLDKKVRIPALVFAYTFGIIGALVLGLGMCFAMKVIGDAVWLGVLIGLVGIAMVSSNYFIYKAILELRKGKYGAQIIKLSEELLFEQNN